MITYVLGSPLFEIHTGTGLTSHCLKHWSTEYHSDLSEQHQLNSGTQTSTLAQGTVMRPGSWFYCLYYEPMRGFAIFAG